MLETYEFIFKFQVLFASDYTSLKHVLKRSSAADDINTCVLNNKLSCYITGM